VDFKVRRAGHIVIRVSDAERSAKFFTEVAGLTVIGSTAREMYFMTADFEANHHMVLVRPARPGSPAPSAGAPIGLAQASFEVDTFADLKALYGRLVKFGASIVRSEDRGAIKALFAFDPDGNLFEFFCRVGDGAPILADHFIVLGDIDAALAAPA
jgi:catechol 2,3-dioxygenase-like lactoylglutathione lyase family enzyme